MTVALEWAPSVASTVGASEFLERSARALSIAVHRNVNVWSGPSSPRWVEDVLERASSVYDLEKGWDGENALPVTKEALWDALDVLTDVMSEDSIAPQVVPTSDGGIQLEWHCAGVDLEVYVEPSGRISAWCCDGDREWEADTYPRARLRKEIGHLTRACCR